jgi:putative transposase
MTADPDGGWVIQQARNLLLALGEQGRQLRFLVRDHDAKFSRSLVDVFCSEGTQVLMTPVWAPTRTRTPSDGSTSPRSGWRS